MNATQLRILRNLIHDWEVDNGAAEEVRIVKTYAHDAYLVTFRGKFIEGNGHVAGYALKESYYINPDGNVTSQT